MAPQFLTMVVHGQRTCTMVVHGRLGYYMVDHGQFHWETLMARCNFHVPYSFVHMHMPDFTRTPLPQQNECPQDLEYFMLFLHILAW